VVVFIEKSQNPFRAEPGRRILKDFFARAGKKEGGLGEGIFARPRFPPPLFLTA